MLLDVVVPPEQVPARLTHRITYELAPDASNLAIIGSHEIRGPELPVDPFAPVVIALPLRGTGWVNANGCCDASAHRSARLAVDDLHLVKFELFAIDWIRLVDNRLFTGDGTRNADYFAFGAEVLAVADGTVASSATGFPEDTPNEPTTVHQPLDYGGNEVVLELEPGSTPSTPTCSRAASASRSGRRSRRVRCWGCSATPAIDWSPPALPVGRRTGHLTATSLPFVIDQYTLVGSVAPESTASDVRVTGTPASKRRPCRSI